MIWPDFRTFPDQDTAFVSAASRAGGPWMFHVMNFTLFVATMGSSLGAQLGSMRLLYAMGRDGVLPRKFFGFLDPVRNTPKYNLYVTGTVIAVGGLPERRRVAELRGVYCVHGSESLGAHAILLCFYIWWSLRTPAKIIGAGWMATGAAYYWWMTKGFTRKVEFAEGIR